MAEQVGIEDNEKETPAMMDLHRPNPPASPLPSPSVVESDAVTKLIRVTTTSPSPTPGADDVDSAQIQADGTSSRTLTPEGQSAMPILSSLRTTETTENPTSWPRPQDMKHSGYFSSKTMHPHPVSSTYLASLTTASTTSSPLQSGYPSSTSLQSSHDGLPSDIGESSPSGILLDASRERPSSSQQTVIITPTQSETNSPTSAPRSPKQSATHRLRDGPNYPNQSFAALQYQYYPSPYHPHQLRTRSSHPSQHSSYSSGSSRRSRDQQSITSGVRTAGNTPAQSPGLFSPAKSKNQSAGDDYEDAQYSTPLLHPSHLSAPKETHTLMKDIDPISGRKTVNNYEFLTKLGSGTHGTVKLGRNLETDEKVAVKIVRRFSKKVRLGKQETPEDQVKKEVAVLKKARHPHVVSLLEVIDDPEFGKVYLILEFIELGEIVWRKRTEKAIAIFEMNRVKREKEDQIDEKFELEELTRINEGAPARILDMKRHEEERSRVLIAEQSPPAVQPKADQESRPIYSPSFSLEYHGEAQDDPNRPGNDTAQEVTERESLPRCDDNDPSEERYSRSNISSEHPNSSTSLHEPKGESIVPNSSHGPYVPSPVKLEGSMWGAYMMDESVDHHEIPGFDAMLADADENTEWTIEEEEFMHVPCLTLSQALEAFRDTVLGLEYLHYQGIIHRDIKPANLLWTADHRVKISDFGVSYLGKPIREDDNREEIPEADVGNLDEAIELAKTVGTPAFYAPELCDPELFDVQKNPNRPQITGQIDVWALGVTLYGMVFGRLPFFDTNEFAMYEKIARQEVFIPKERLRGVEDAATTSMNSNKRSDHVVDYEAVDDELRDLLKRLLHKDPTRRITLKEVKHHPWVLKGIKDVSVWIDETDPSLQSQGKKIEVSGKEVDEAVVGLSLFDRVRTGIKRLGSVVRGRDTRKRGDSTVKPGDIVHSPTMKHHEAGKEGRRSSLRGDEQIYSALRASKEISEHPLAQSSVISPEATQDRSYFTPEAPTVNESAPLSGSSPLISRPSPPERGISTVSTAESMKTIRAPVPLIMRQSSPPAQESLPYATALIEPTSSGLSGIFGGAGRRFIRSMQSRERGSGRDSASQSSRSSSIERIPGGIEDPHASPSIAFSSAVAAGHVDQPPVPLDEFTKGPPPVSTSQVHPSEASAENFQRAQELNYQKHIREAERNAESRSNSALTSPSYECPPSPDDVSFQRQQSQQVPPQAPSHDMIPPNLSSSDDYMASGISESFSYPSIPSVVSGASSLSGPGEDQQNMPADGVVISSAAAFEAQSMPAAADSKVKRHSRGPALEDDDVGYNGDGDEESDDEGIMFGRKR